MIIFFKFVYKNGFLFIFAKHQFLEIDCVKTYRKASVVAVYNTLVFLVFIPSMHFR